MKAILKWTALILGGLIGVLVIAILALYSLGNSRLNNARVTARPVAVPAEAAALARGEHLVEFVSLCVACHGANLEGQPFIDEPPVGFIAAPNLTGGAGGIGAMYTPEDWERAIRHGVAADSRALGAMPSDSYAHLSDDDVAAMIAYLQSVPPVDNELPARAISVPGTIIFGVLDYQSLPVARIDHAAVGSSTPTDGLSAEYGQYLVNIAVCRDCHGAELAGRTPEEAETGPPAGPNLAAAGNLGNWTAEEFMIAMRTGRTPDGRQLSDAMPWPYYAGMVDDELQAIWLYLQSLPAGE